MAANTECYGNREKGVIHFVRGNEETIRDEVIFSLQCIIVKFFKHMEDLSDDYNRRPDSTMVCHIVFLS